MKEYYIKIENMYLDDVSTDIDSIKTSFIYKISFRNKSEYAFKINEDEKEKWAKLLAKTLKIDIDSITFEEIKEEEK